MELKRTMTAEDCVAFRSAVAQLRALLVLDTAVTWAEDAEKWHTFATTLYPSAPR
jgi:hypothetical protein